MNQIPERLTNYTAYLSATNFLGTVDVELPNLENLTDTVSGAGIAGEVDSPTIGHFAPMTAKLNFRTASKDSVKLAGQKTHELDFRGSQQIRDTSNGTYKHQPVKVSIRATPKVLTTGTFAVGSTTGTSNELSVTYMKIEIDGVRVLEVDIYNYICFIDGVDYLAQVRKNLGM